MHKSIVFAFSFFLTLSSHATLASTYEIAPASTPVKIDANTTALKEISQALEKLAETSKKSLVFISVSKTMRGQQYIDPFEYFFGRQGPMGPPPPQPRQEGFGSGFFIDLDKGYILTNNHVVENADKITLKLANGKTYDGKIVGHDKDTDVAVVQVIDKNFSREGLSFLVLDDSDKVSIGSFVVALGAPFLLEASITFGIVSAVGRGNLKLTKMGNFIQTDTAINPGNSGGPLINMDGKVIGINSAIFSQSGAYAGIGFSIPSNIARRIATSLINKGSFYKGYVGISYEPVREEWTKSLDLPKGTKGIIIAEVLPGGPAHKAGLEAGDVVVAIDGQGFDSDNLTSIIGLREPGSPLKFTLYRQGKKHDVEMKVATADALKQAIPASANAPKPRALANQDLSRFGFALAPVDEKLRAQYGFSSKTGLVIVYLEPVSVAWSQGFREGDVITRVNNKTVTSLKDFDAITRGHSMLVMQVDRKGRSLVTELKSEHAK